MTLVNACTEIALVAAGVSGIKRAPTYPPEGINESPYVLTYIQAGDMDIASEGSRHSLWDINCDLLVARKNMTDDMTKLVALIDPIKTAFAAEVSTNGDQFNNSIETFRNLHVEFVPEFVYQSAQYIGYRFTLQGVKFIEYP